MSTLTEAEPRLGTVPPSGAAAAPTRPPLEVFTATGRTGGPARHVARRLASPLGIYTVPVLVVVIWQVANWRGWASQAFAASPVQIYRAGVQLWQDGLLGPDLVSSLTRAGSGLAIGLSVGVVAAVIAGLWRAGEQAFNGVVQILNTIPLLALLPLMIVWFGIGEKSKVLLIALGAGVPIYLNLFAAIRGVDQGLVEMARAAGAGRWRLIRRLLLPGSLPGLLVGLRFALAYSVLGLVAAEQVNADSGIGFMINQAQTYERVDQIYLGIVIYAILGLAADQIVRVFERVLLTWRPNYTGS
ncbi:MAG: sulfonate transport system permease protein [Pseudonocardiales bacterium]|nr:sulfonate transport system permease protein [Pseudonocardiales bacterium]